MRVKEVKKEREFVLQVTEAELRELYEVVGETPGGGPLQELYGDIKTALFGG